MPSRGFAEFTVTSTALFPWVTRTEPFDCLARRPVSMVTGFPSTVHVTVSIPVLIPSLRNASLRFGDASVGTAARLCAGALRSSHVSHLFSTDPTRVRSLLSGGISRLAAQPQLVDQGLVPPFIGTVQVVGQAPPLADEIQEPAARAVVLHLRLQMIGEIRDPPGQERDLDLA